MGKFNKLGSIILIIALILTGSLMIYAASDSWNYSDYSHGSYCPKSGSMKSSFSSGYAYTKVEFELDSKNVTSIKQSNNGENSADPGVEGYLTIDVTSVRNSSEDKMDAYSITSNLPNPKFDMENDDIFGSREEESETVVLGTVKANKEYYMKTKWEDLRSGEKKDDGQWQCQFGMSKKGWSDYNNYRISDVIQAIVKYGKNAGKD